MTYKFGIELLAKLIRYGYKDCPPTGSESGLQGYWKFNEGSGNIVTDLTSNGINGTINGAGWSNTNPNQYCNN